MKTKNENNLKEKIAKVFSDFFHDILVPYFEDKFNEIDKRFDENEKDHEKIFRALERNIPFAFENATGITPSRLI